MTASDWEMCPDPAETLTVLRECGASERKLLLFAVGCCRRAFPYTDHDGSRALVELVERHLEGDVPTAELESAYQAHERWCSEATPEWDYLNGADRAALDTAAPHGVQLVDYIAKAAAKGIVEAMLAPVYRECNMTRSAMPLPDWQGEQPPSADEVIDYAHRMDAAWEPVEQARAEWLAQEQAVQAVLVRDVFGNPFQPAAVDPSWRTDTVVALARGIYEERAFDRLPLLMDALMDAGCDNDDILEHCRSGDAHVRGCWVIDLILGKS